MEREIYYSFATNAKSFHVFMGVSGDHAEGVSLLHKTMSDT